MLCLHLVCSQTFTQPFLPQLLLPQNLCLPRQLLPQQSRFSSHLPCPVFLPRSLPLRCHSLVWCPLVNGDGVGLPQVGSKHKSWYLPFHSSQRNCVSACVRFVFLNSGWASGPMGSEGQEGHVEFFLFSIPDLDSLGTTLQTDNDPPQLLFSHLVNIDSHHHCPLDTIAVPVQDISVAPAESFLNLVQSFFPQLPHSLLSLPMGQPRSEWDEVRITSLFLELELL